VIVQGDRKKTFRKNFWFVKCIYKKTLVSRLFKKRA